MFAVAARRRVFFARAIRQVPTSGAKRQVPNCRNLPYHLTRRLDAKNVVAAYEYDGLNRRILKSASNIGVGRGTGLQPVGLSESRGLETHATRDGTEDADGLAAGDRVEHYYYAGWRVIEETDAASTLCRKAAFRRESGYCGR